jgi:hypothetical protein|tara:strand:- start:5243 stop:5968 length:726 start_codon:yes stop_codon:yes gene_type:complete
VSGSRPQEFKDQSNPLINIDLSLGLMLKFQYALTTNRHLGLRFVPLGHESSTLGTGYAESAQRRQSRAGFTVAPVSYEYWEYGVSFDTPRFTARHGGIGIWSGGRTGFYAPVAKVPRLPITPSASNYEPSIGLEYRASHNPDPGSWGSRFLEILPESYAPFLSVDLRHRIIFDFHKTGGPEAPEERRLSINFLAGFRAPVSNRFRVLREAYVRIYHGVNPYGQLRTEQEYTLFGFGFNIGL